MIATAFDKVGFPIVPQVTARSDEGLPQRSLRDRFRRLTNSTHPSLVFRRSPPTLITPRDFDLSPYFEVIKFNVIESQRFDYSKIVWAEDER
jgi:hypothetical protein